MAEVWAEGSGQNRGSWVQVHYGDGGGLREGAQVWGLAGGEVVGAAIPGLRDTSVVFWGP